MPSTTIRSEAPGDARAVRSLTETAFRDADHTSGTEGAIVDALRQAGALSVSLVLEQDGDIVGHVAFSPIRIGGEERGWFGLGPVSVLPSRQREGIGTALIEAGLDRLKRRGAKGCVVLGDPAYYRRFGFTSDHGLRYADVPPAYFQSLLLSDEPVEGVVTYHEGFAAR